MLFRDVVLPNGPGVDGFGMVRQEYRADVAPVLYARGAAHVAGGVYVGKHGGVSAIRALIGPGIQQDFNPKYYQDMCATHITINLPCWQTNTKALQDRLLAAFRLSDEVNVFFAYVPHAGAEMSLWTNWSYGKAEVVELRETRDGDRSIWKAELRRKEAVTRV